MTDTAELVRVLREQAKKNSAKIFLPVDVYPEWQAAAALEATQARADKLEEELAEAKRQRDWLASEKEQAIRLKEAAESSLAAAKERMSLVQRCIGARMGQMTPVQRECAVNAAWWLLNDVTGIRPASEKPEFVNRVIAELVRDCADALKTAAGKEIPRRQLFADMEEAWVNQKHYWRCKGCPDCQGVK